jgi:hypothetical protein
VRIGIPVRIGFEVVNDWLTLPKFFPVRRHTSPRARCTRRLLDKGLGSQYINCEFQQGQSL